MAAAMMPAGAADDGITYFDRFLKSTPAALMEFRQVAFDANGRLLSEGVGRLWFSQPWKYRLEYDAPDHFLLISDGETVWEYDQDLQQVIIRPFSSEGLSGIFAALSAGDLDVVREHYTLYSGIGGDLRWAGADAISSDNSVRRVRLGFDGTLGDLKQVEIIDAFDGVVRMDIYHLEKGAEDTLFHFTPPPGVDVVYERR